MLDLYRWREQVARRIEGMALRHRRRDMEPRRRFARRIPDLLEQDATGYVLVASRKTLAQQTNTKLYVVEEAMQEIGGLLVRERYLGSAGTRYRALMAEDVARLTVNCFACGDRRLRENTSFDPLLHVLDGRGILCTDCERHRRSPRALSSCVSCAAPAAPCRINGRNVCVNCFVMAVPETTLILLLDRTEVELDLTQVVAEAGYADRPTPVLA